VQLYPQRAARRVTARALVAALAAERQRLFGTKIGLKSGFPNLR